MSLNVFTEVLKYPVLMSFMSMQIACIWLY